MSAQNTIIATYIPSGDAFEGAARAAETASAIVFRDGINRILTGEEPGAETVVVAAEAWRRSDTEALIGAQAALGRATWVEVTEASQVQPAIAAGAQGLAGAVPGLLRGKPAPHISADRGFSSHNAECVELGFDCGFTVDGEIYPERSGEIVRLSADRRIRFVRA